MIKKIVLTTCVVALVGAVLFFALSGSAEDADQIKTVAVERGEIVDKALAVGRIVPKMEVSVKSKIGGIVRKTYVDIGDYVNAGDPLFDIAPDPTPIEYAEAKRNLEIYQVAYDNASREFERTKALNDRQLISNQEFDSKKAVFDEADLRLKLAQEKLSLIESGRAQIADIEVDNIIKSPISGTVLSRLVEEGDPIVPLTSYQAGTDLMTLARMDNLVFKGNVDEIDVGKLYPNMVCEIEIGAIPDKKLKGILTKISPKAHREEGSTLFEVEAVIDATDAVALRAGYSANAEVIIVRKVDIILVPERLVTIRDSISYVEVQDSSLTITEREIKTGLSDGIKIEVTEGLVEGELVVERPPKEIEIWD